MAEPPNAPPQLPVGGDTPEDDTENAECTPDPISTAPQFSDVAIWQKSLAKLRLKLAGVTGNMHVTLLEESVVGQELHLVADSMKPFLLTPRALMVAWGGVITLAYTGWPPQVNLFKAQIESAVGNSFIPEQPGSRWPKTTLAVLQDGKTLSLEQLQRLNSVLEKSTARIFASGWRQEATELGLTLFKCSSHERLYEWMPLPLKFGPLDLAEPDAESKTYTEQVLAEGSDLAAYLPRVQMAGSREMKYREFRPGSSIVVFVQPPCDELAQLREAVEAEVPGLYTWLGTESLHCTVRGVF